MDDTRHLGRLFEVLGLDENGRPKDTDDPMDVDLRPLTVADLVALQGRVTAEFARRLGAMDRPAYAFEPVHGEGMVTAAWDATIEDEDRGNPRRRA